MDELKKGLIWQIDNPWKYGNYSLGVNLTTYKMNEFREFYIYLNLTGWSLCIGWRF